ncbi:hypothetical protein Hanom_Chr13g01216881 [Helianthus anomalus]
MIAVMTPVLKVKLSTIQSKATSLILPRLELVYVVLMIFTLFLGTFGFLNETVLHVVVYLQQWSATKVVYMLGPSFIWMFGIHCLHLSPNIDNQCVPGSHESGLCHQFGASYEVTVR